MKRRPDGVSTTRSTTRLRGFNDAPAAPNDARPTTNREPTLAHWHGRATRRPAHDPSAVSRATAIGRERRHGQRRRSTRPLLDHHPGPTTGTAMTGAVRAGTLEWPDAPGHVGCGTDRSPLHGRGRQLALAGPTTMSGNRASYPASTSPHSPTHALWRSSVAHRTSPAAGTRVRRTSGTCDGAATDRSAQRRHLRTTPWTRPVGRGLAWLVSTTRSTTRAPRSVGSTTRR